MVKQKLSIFTEMTCIWLHYDCFVTDYPALLSELIIPAKDIWKRVVVKIINANIPVDKSSPFT